MLSSSVPVVTPAAFKLGDGRSVTVAERLGVGEHASVYRGWTDDAYKLQRPVALKVFNNAPLDGDALAKLARVIRYSAYVNHPNVVDTRGMGVGEDGVPFVVTQLVSGCSLALLAKAYAAVGRRIPTDLALFIGIEVAEGLLAARHVLTPDGSVLGITHHDLSPRQVLLSWEGEVKVSDFGVRMALPLGSGVRDLQRMTRRVTYLSPEEIGGARGDARSDVFALGVMMFEILRSARFPAEVHEMDLLKLAKDGYIHTGITDPILPSEISEVLFRATQIDPAERYAHAGVFAYDLRKITMGMGVGDGRAFLRSALGEMSEGLSSMRQSTTPPGDVDEVPIRSSLFDENETTERVSIADIILAESGEIPVSSKREKI